MPVLRVRPSLLLLLATLLVASCLGSCAVDRTTRAPAVLTQEEHTSGVLDPTDEATFERLLDDLEGRRLIFLGEIHDRYDHHVNQLQVIRGLHARGRALAIGLEAFQEPFQPYLDAYIAGRMDETEMLRRTEYYDRWRFDYRLYRDLLRFARDQGIPLVALNAPTELVDAVSDKGVAGLAPWQRAQLPEDIPPPDAAYRERLIRAFAMHGDLPEQRFERFLQVQAVWDEYMARESAEFLARDPDKTLVVLVGSAHVLHGSAIPERVKRRIDASNAVIVTAPFTPLPGIDPDYVLAPRDIQLPPRGRTGLTLLQKGDRVLVRGVLPGSAAEKAGIAPGDRIRRIGKVPVQGLADVRLALTDSAPGDRLTVSIEPEGSDTGKRSERVLRLL
jgi:uncharacterized iron-regulated protein